MIIIKTEKEIELMRQGGKILAEIMEEIGKNIAPGKNTLELDQLAERLVFANEGSPIFKGQGEKSNPYPATICASINDEIVHGIPSEKRIIREGDLVKIDMGIKFRGMITDMARTFEVGNVSVEARNLSLATREALEEGMKKIKAGARLSEFGRSVESYVKARGFSVVRELVGHGVGRTLHEDPQIPNYFWKREDVILKEGMTLALEPMINAGKNNIKFLPDGWTIVTADSRLSAHFENTILVKKGGCEILTKA